MFFLTWPDFNCLLQLSRIINSQIILPIADFYDPALHFASILHLAELVASRSDSELEPLDGVVHIYILI